MAEGAILKPPVSTQSCNFYDHCPPSKKREVRGYLNREHSHKKVRVQSVCSNSILSVREFVSLDRVAGRKCKSRNFASIISFSLSLRSWGKRHEDIETQSRMLVVSESIIDPWM